jgi:tetratricopeptide (TPR) repeat protein
MMRGGSTIGGSRNPLAAYRRDLRGTGASTFGPDDGVWLAVAALVARAARLGRTGACYLDEAAALAAQWLSARLRPLRPAHDPDTGAALSSIAAVRALAEAVEEAGALYLADSLVEAACELADVEPIDRGRLGAQRGRIARKLGRIERAERLFRETRRRGARLDSDELRVRGWIGLGSIAQVRGNYPELHRWSRRAVALAERRGYRRLAASARAGLLIRAARAGRFEAAIRHGWRILRDVAGDRTAEAEALINLAQLFLDMGQPAVAHAAYATVLVRTAAPRLVVPGLGGFALACARTRDAAGLAWAVDQLTQRATIPTPTYETAMALIDAAAALEQAGQGLEARRLARRARALGRRYGYHEVTMAPVAAIVPAAAPPAVIEPSPKITYVAARILELAPSELPDCVTVTV